jgi:hypothetical protein
MTEAAHSYWSASKFEADMLCPGKHVLEAGAPDNSNKYSAEGTAAHQVLTWALQEERPASAYLGRVVHIDKLGRVCEQGDAEYTYVVDEDMAAALQITIDYVLDLQGGDGALFADIRVNYSSYLGVNYGHAWGTADVIIARGDEIIVVDLKFGRGVEVSAENNPQMSLYALGALQAYQGICGDFTRVRMAISQPRIKAAPSEWDCSVTELEAWGVFDAAGAIADCLRAAEAADDDDGNPEAGVVDPVWQDTYLKPGEKQCKFCKVKATCPALRAEVGDQVFSYSPASPDEFAEQTPGGPTTESGADWLAACLSKVDLIEDWCKAIRAETERRLLAGDSVPGYKLVAGKRGARQWIDPVAAEAALKAMRLKVDLMYDFTVKSPTQIAKLGPAFDKDGKLKPTKPGTEPPVIGPRQWPKVQALITQPDGRPHVAPESDSRPALVVTPVIDDFTDVTTESLA